MRLRDALLSAAVLLVAVIHFALQWVGWKEHIEQVALRDGMLAFLPEHSLWPTLSFPLFSLVPRHLQYSHFFSLLIVNSAMWGISVVAAGSFLVSMSRRLRYRRLLRSASAMTWADQLVELKRLSDRGKITPEEYLRRRQAILSGWSDQALRKPAPAKTPAAPAARAPERVSRAG